MPFRILLLIFWMTGSSAWGQVVGTTDDVQKGHHLAILLCEGCHLVAPDQPYAPTFLQPAAPSFQSIAQRPDTTVDSLRKFLTTTYQGPDNPNGMPNPGLADFQIRQIA